MQMMKLFYSLFLLFLMIGCSDSPQLGKLSRDSVILAFGDSLTYGSGVKEQYSYPAVLQTLTNSEVINAGVPGEVTADGLERLQQALPEYQPNLVILCHGGNDILRRNGNGQTKANLLAMVQLIKASGADVILLGVPDFGISLSAASFYEEVATESKIPVELNIVPYLERSREYKSDPIHFNQAGYRKMAEAIMDALKESGAIE
jgi:lysophospholipase L1-like esterase